jgi:hypothetical protein
MEESEKDVSPKYSEVKVDLTRSSLIEYRVLKRELIVCISFKNVGKHARPTSPHCVVKHGKPVDIENLA